MPDKRASIQLRDPAAIRIVVQRSKRERRSRSSALSVIVHEWAEFKSIFLRNRTAARRARSLPENGQDNGAGVNIQGENPPAVSPGGDNKEKETNDVGKTKNQFHGRESSGEDFGESASDVPGGQGV